MNKQIQQITIIYPIYIGDFQSLLKLALSLKKRYVTPAFKIDTAVKIQNIGESCLGKWQATSPTVWVYKLILLSTIESVIS